MERISASAEHTLGSAAESMASRLTLTE